MSDEIELHDYEVIREESETGLRITRLKVNGGWIYFFAAIVGMATEFVPEPEDQEFL